jgi:hypothetical protein
MGFVEASWMARIVACAMLLTWSWFFGRWYDRKWMAFERKWTVAATERDT